MIDSDRQNVSTDDIAAGLRRQIDDTDRALLDALVADGRSSLTEIAERINLSRSTVHARMQRLQADGVIAGFTALVDPALVGLGVAALVFVDIDQHDWRSLRDQLLAVPGVEYLAMCAGRFDVMMLVRAATIGDFRDVLLEQIQRIAGVRSTETIFILDEARRR